MNCHLFCYVFTILFFKLHIQTKFLTKQFFAYFDGTQSDHNIYFKNTQASTAYRTTHMKVSLNKILSCLRFAIDLSMATSYLKAKNLSRGQFLIISTF